jgi:hypothetical protein
MVDESGCCEANEPNCGAFIKTTTLTPTICRPASRTVFFFLMVGDPFRQWEGIRKTNTASGNTTMILRALTLQPSVSRVTSIHIPQGLCNL